MEHMIVGLVLGLLLAGSASAAPVKKSVNATSEAAAPRQISPITLSPSAAFPNTLIETIKVYTGACGSRVVRIVGVTDVNDKSFTLDIDGRIIIHQGQGPDLVIDSNNGLSDYNGVACVERNDGSARLLIWANCGGSACGDDYGFVVVDPEKMKIVSSNDCDEMCGYALTGSRLPWALNDKAMP